MLIAVAQIDKSGKRLGFYTIDVHDDTNTPVARMLATVLRNPQG
jgi:acyl-coenzyme A thioesterase PaaI-like protein